MLGYALTLGDTRTWWGLARVLTARLTMAERGALAFAALHSLDPDARAEVAEVALCSGAGAPISPVTTYMDEAAFWADMAEPAELDAYALACVRAMKPGRRAAFLDFVQGRQAA